MSKFVHLRHKEPIELREPRPLIVAMPPMRSNVNVSRIVRAAGGCGVRRMIVCGNPKLDPEITRDAIPFVDVQTRRSLPPVLKELQGEGYPLIGLEQTTGSQDIHHFAFPRRMVLIVGHERDGLSQEILDLLDATVEIPVYGMPYSFNAATSAVMALYEYCRQYPEG